MKKTLFISVLLAALIVTTWSGFSSFYKAVGKSEDRSSTVYSKWDFVGDLELTGGKASPKTIGSSLQKSLFCISIHLFTSFSSKWVKKEASANSLLPDAYLSHIYPSHNFW